MATGFIDRVFLLLHLVAVVVAFGPTLLYPVLARRARTGRAEEAGVLTDAAGDGTTRLALPGIGAVFVTGVLLVVAVDGVAFSDVWISIAFLLVFIAAAILGLLVRPNQRRMAALAAAVAAGGPDAAAAQRELDERQAKTAAYLGALHLVLLLALVDMIWKPGA